MSRAQVGRKVGKKVVSLQLPLGALRIKTMWRSGRRRVSWIVRDVGGGPQEQKDDVRAGSGRTGLHGADRCGSVLCAGDE